MRPLIKDSAKAQALAQELATLLDKGTIRGGPTTLTQRLLLNLLPRHQEGRRILSHFGPSPQHFLSHLQRGGSCLLYGGYHPGVPPVPSGDWSNPFHLEGVGGSNFVATRPNWK